MVQKLVGCLAGLTVLCWAERKGQKTVHLLAERRAEWWVGRMVDGLAWWKVAHLARQKVAQKGYPAVAR